MRVSLLVALWLFALLAGCSSQIRPVKAVPELSPEQKNNIVILRNHNFISAAARFFPTIDGNEVSGLFPKEHVSLNLFPGRHRIGVRCGFGDEELQVIVKPGEKYYYKLTPSVFSLINPFSCGAIEEIAEEEALGRLKQSVRISTGHLSDCNKRSVTYENAEDHVCFSSVIP